MHTVRITVVKKCYNEELVKEYSTPDFPICDIQEVGQTFETRGEKPEGLCDAAWHSMYHQVYAIIHGDDVDFYNGGWLRKKSSTMAACHDGLRPVIYLLEAID